MTHERVAALYEAYAAQWDGMRGRDLFERPWLERFAALLPQGGSVLDIGCGMGEPIGRWFIERGFALTGIDTSPSLLAIARSRLPASKWLVADMRRLALGERFDGLLAWHSSFHLPPDAQRALFPRLAAHSKPGGHLMFTSGEDEGIRIGEWMGEPLYHASLAPKEYRALLDENGFDLLEGRLRDPQCGDATVWIARRRCQSR